MSRQPKPTHEELVFIYSLIMKGYSNSDILNEYTRLYELSQLIFPLRGDKRFIKERRKELESAKQVLKEQTKTDDPLVIDAKKKSL